MRRFAIAVRAMVLYRNGMDFKGLVHAGCSIGFSGVRVALFAALWLQAAFALELPFIFEQRVNEGVYQEEVLRMDPKQLDPALVRSSPFPIWGIEVTRVTPGSQAERQGLTVGSVIHRMNGKDRWSHLQNRQTGERVFEVVMPDGKSRTFEFEEGIIGTRSGNRHRPEKYLLQRLPQGPWEVEMLVAVQAWRTGMNDLAETAIRKAMDKGMSWNVFCSYYGAQLALDRGNAPVAKAMLELLLDELRGDEEIPRFFRPGVRTLAYAMQDFELLRKAIAELDGFRDELQVVTVDAWRKWAATGKPESLLTKARAFKGENVMAEVIATQGVTGLTRMGLDSLRKGFLREAGKPGSYRDHLFSPPKAVSDFIWETRVAFEQTGDPGKVDDTLNDLSFSLVDPAKMTPGTGWDPNRWCAARFSVWHDWNGDRNIRLLANPGSGSLSMQRFVPRMSREVVNRFVKQVDENGPVVEIPASCCFKLTLIRIGDEVEILVDDKTFLHLPIDPGMGPLACEIHNVGMALSLENMTMCPIILPEW